MRIDRGRDTTLLVGLGLVAVGIVLLADQVLVECEPRSKLDGATSLRR